MLDKYNQAIQKYFEKWYKLLETRSNKQFFAQLQPTAIGWKVADRTEYNTLLTELHDSSDMIVEKWMNGRWIAKVHLKDTELDHDMQIIKIMERRPGSSDAVGLDHIDFYDPSRVDLTAVLNDEKDIRWSQESNDVMADYEWLSVWFADTEAKLKHYTVLGIIGAELDELERQIIHAATKR